MSIRARLLMIAVIATVIAVSMVARRHISDRQRQIAMATQQLPLLAGGISNALGEAIQGTGQLLYGLARARDLDTNDRAACSKFLSEVRNRYPQYTGILTIRPDGRLFCDSLNTGRELDLNDRAYFRQIATGGSAIVTEPVFGRLTGVAVLQIAYPVRAESGELRFVLLASLNLQRLVHAQLDTSPDRNAKVLLLDHKGMVLVAEGAPEYAKLRGTSMAQTDRFRFADAHPGGAVSESDLLDGKAEVWAVGSAALAQAAGIHVMAGLSKDELVAAANRRFAQDLGLLALAAVIIFLGVWYLAERGIRRPVEAIADMVRRLGRNEPHARIPGPFPHGELGVLMQVLNQTAQAQEDQRAAFGRLNDELRQAQRLESVGQLTGGVAHDFNNLLTVILGNAELLQEQLAASSPRLAAQAGMIVQASERGADLTKRLLAFARKQALAPRVVDVNALVASMDELVRRTLGANIQIEVVAAAGLWRALVDPAQLDNALLNLCLNSRDAMMPRGGRLTIETANVHAGQDYADTHSDVHVGQYVMLAVSDTGTGIAPENRARVFEPFFTTKEKGKGTGLGLSMVYGFIKQSHGHVSIYSEPGQGTTVKLYLPRATQDAAAAAGARPDPAPPQQPKQDQDSGTVLLVEDDEEVRHFAREQLAALGYKVLEASDGAAALEIVIRSGLDGGLGRGAPPAIDLLFTDVMMPGMSGRELADAALQLRPGMKVLFTSGYTENAIVHHGRLDAGAQLLAKPYRREELARRVREVLGGVST